MIGQAICIGDARPYNTALIVLDADFAPQWATQQGIEASSLEQLAAEPKVIAEIQSAIDSANEQLSRVEQIKKFTILDHDLSVETGELTPSLKVKRNVIYDRYGDVFESLYSG
jgi:long-chain acyl-CoA synthetase